MREQTIIWHKVDSELPAPNTYVLITFSNGEVEYYWQEWANLPGGVSDCTYISRDSRESAIPEFIDPVEWAYVELVYMEK